jgi:hypothetical protein
MGWRGGWWGCCVRDPQFVRGELIRSRMVVQARSAPTGIAGIERMGGGPGTSSVTDGSWAIARRSFGRRRCSEPWIRR